VANRKVKNKLFTQFYKDSLTFTTKCNTEFLLLKAQSNRYSDGLRLTIKEVHTNVFDA